VSDIQYDHLLDHSYIAGKKYPEYQEKTNDLIC